MDGKCKSLLVINESTDAHVKLNFYLTWDIVCWLPYASKVIKPNDKFFHSCEEGRKVELVARFKGHKQPKKVLLKPQQWAKDMMKRITSSLDVVEDNLANYPDEKKAGLRKMHRDEELASLDGGCNLYNILRLDMKEVRAMSKDEQDEEITRAFRRELQIWHRDHNDDGDDDIAREVIMAYDILRDREKRARYNNMADYDSGWLSGKRFKAVFWPECETVAQRLSWMKRMGLLGLSVGLTLGGILSVVLTAGFSTPFLAGAVVGGLNALGQAISREAVVDGCDVKKWLMATGVGYFLAFLPGGAAIGVALLESTALTVGELIGIRTAIAAGCGAISSLGSDAKKRFIEGENVTLKQALGHAACQSAAWAAAALAGSAAAKAMVAGSQTTTAAANLEEAFGEQVSPLSDQAKHMARDILCPLAKNATKVVLDKAAEFVEKLLDDSVENLSRKEHHIDKQDCTQDMASAHHALVSALADTNEPIAGNVRYISKGLWFSKMVVSYFQNGEEITKQVRGNGKQVNIPSDADRIKVRFKVLRPPWGDIIKYDRFQRCWCEPYEPHVFEYETPQIRTFTIRGNLWWEAVMGVSDEHSEETKEI